MQAAVEHREIDQTSMINAGIGVAICSMASRYIESTATSVNIEAAIRAYHASDLVSSASISIVRFGASLIMALRSLGEPRCSDSEGSRNGDPSWLQETQWDLSLDASEITSVLSYSDAATCHAGLDAVESIWRARRCLLARLLVLRSAFGATVSSEARGF